MARPTSRSSLEDIKLGQALLKHRLLPASRLLELTRESERDGIPLRTALARGGIVSDSIVQMLLDGTYVPPPKPARPAPARNAVPAPPSAATTAPKAPAVAQGPTLADPQEAEPAKARPSPLRPALPVDLVGAAVDPSATGPSAPVAFAPPSPEPMRDDLDVAFGGAPTAPAPPGPPAPASIAHALDAAFGETAIAPALSAASAPTTSDALDAAGAGIGDPAPTPAEPRAAASSPTIVRRRPEPPSDAAVGGALALASGDTRGASPDPADPQLPAVPTCAREAARAVEEPGFDDPPDPVPESAPTAVGAPDVGDEPPAVQAFEPFVIDEHFLCRRVVRADDPAIESAFEAQHTTDQLFGVLLLLDDRRSRSRDAEAVRARAEAVADLRNPCIQQVLGSGEWQKRTYWVEERIEGSLLPEILAAGPLPAKSIASIVADVAEALAEAHGRGLTHGGLELESVVITPSGRPRIVGFCRIGRDAPVPGGFPPGDARARKDVAALIRVLQRLVDGGPVSGGRGPDESDPVGQALRSIYRVGNETQPSRQYASAARLAADLRDAIAGEAVHPPGSSAVWRALSGIGRWIRFSWLLGFLVVGSVIGFFGNDQYQKWREIQTARASIHTVESLQLALEPYIARGEGHLAQARRSLAAGRFPEAGEHLKSSVREFDAAVSLCPQYHLSRPAYLGRCQAKLLQGSFSGAVADAESAMRVVPTDATPNYLRALGLLADLHCRQRWVVVGRGKRLRFDRIPVSGSDALLREAQRSLEETCRSVTATDRAQARGAAAVALQAYGAGRKEEALSLLRDACARDPEHRVAHEALLYSVVSTAPVDVEAALGLVAHLLQRVPDHPRLFALRAELWLLKENAVRAQDDIEEALRRAPGEGWLHEILAKVRFARGLPDQAMEEIATALRTEPDSGPAWRVRASFQRRLGRPDAALEDLARALAHEQADVDTLLERAAILEDLGRLPEAAVEFGRAVQLEPARPESWVGRLRCALRGGDFDEAGRVLPAAVETHSGVAAIALALGILRCRNGDFRAAVRSLDKALDLSLGETVEEEGEGGALAAEAAEDERGWAAFVRVPCPPAGILHTRAMCHLRAGAPDLALRDLDAALALERDFAASLAVRGELSLEAGRLGVAAQDAARLVTLRPRSIPALVLRARVLERKGEIPAAKADLDAALRLSPDDEDALARRGLLQQARGNWDGALQDFDRLIQKHPRSAGPWSFRAGVAAARRDYARAREDYETALTLDPRLSDAHLGLARLLAETGRVREALTQLDRALILLPEDAALLAARGGLRVKNGDPDGASKDYDAAVALRPRDPVLVTNRGVTRQALGRPDLALADYGKAIEISPDFAPARLNRGLLLLLQHRAEEALIDLDRALEARGDWNEAYLARARAREELGKPEEALVDYGQAIRCRPNGAHGYLSRALLLVRLGRDGEARSDLSRALSLDPSLASAIAPELKQILSTGR